MHMHGLLRQPTRRQKQEVSPACRRQDSAEIGSDRKEHLVLQRHTPAWLKACFGKLALKAFVISDQDNWMG